MMQKMILVAAAIAMSGCVTQPTVSGGASSGTGGATMGSVLGTTGPGGCKYLGGSVNPLTAAAVGGVLGAVVGSAVADRRSVGARNGLLLGALAGGLIGSQMKSAIKMVEMDDGSVRLDIPGSVLFASGESNISGGFKSTLDSVGTTINEYCGLTAEVVGHTDSVGRPQANQLLSERRAQAVVAHLTSAGVPAGRLKFTGMGPNKPVADNTTEAGRQQNRRVEIFVRPPAP